MLFTYVAAILQNTISILKDTAENLPYRVLFLANRSCRGHTAVNDAIICSPKI